MFTAKARLTPFWVDVDHVHMWEVLGSTVKIFVIGTLDWPPHVDWGVNTNALYPLSSLRADTQIEAEKTLPATSAGEFELIVTPKEHSSFIIHLAACTQETSGHFFANVL